MRRFSTMRRFSARKQSRAVRVEQPAGQISYFRGGPGPGPMSPYGSGARRGGAMGEHPYTEHVPLLVPVRPLDDRETRAGERAGSTAAPPRDQASETPRTLKFSESLPIL